MNLIPKYRQLLVLWVVAFLATSAGDVWTTECGRHRNLAKELSPIGFQPLDVSIAMEAMIFAVLAASLLSGLAIMDKTYTELKGKSFSVFFWRSHKRMRGFALILGPVVFVVLRLLPVINNSSQLLWGRSPFEFSSDLGSALHLTSNQSHFFFLWLCVMTSYVPACLLIYRMTTQRQHQDHSAEQSGPG